MEIDDFINKVLQINNAREQFQTEVYITSKYYEVVIKRLYITDIKRVNNQIIITINNKRIQKLMIMDDMTYGLRTDTF